MVSTCIWFHCSVHRVARLAASFTCGPGSSPSKGTLKGARANMTSLIKHAIWTGTAGLSVGCPTSVAMPGPCRAPAALRPPQAQQLSPPPSTSSRTLAACRAYRSGNSHSGSVSQSTPRATAAAAAAATSLATCGSASSSTCSPLATHRRRRRHGRGLQGPAPTPTATATPLPPARSTISGNGQVGPPPPRKPHHKDPKPGGGGGGAKGDKQGPSGAAGGVAVAPPSAAVLPSVFDAALDEDVGLDELDEEAGQQLAPYMDAVVKVYCMHTEPNYSLPWQRKRQYSSSSSGFLVRYSGRTWLLTNAHSVDYHTQVKVKRRGDDRKFLARVISVGVDCDIAALEVDDPDFWGGAGGGEGAAGAAAGAEAAGGAREEEEEAQQQDCDGEGPAAAGEVQGRAGGPPVLELGPLPRLQDGVAVVGYPIGGDTISVTAGVVSRIEVTDYSHGSTDLLAIQIDAAINGGNSGGPVFNRACQCVGIAFQALVGSDVENVGYVIPTPVVAHFLEDYLRTGTFSGFPALGVQWQRMESDALRRAYGMAPGQKGVLVRGVNPTAAAAAVLRSDDVLLAFDGRPISNDGTVPFRTGERISFSYLVTNKFVGDEARLDVLRGGQRLEVKVTLSKPTALVPPHLSNRDPPYLIVGGLVFTTATEPYLQSEYGSEYGSDAPVKLLDRLYHGFPGSADEEVVVLSQVLACDATLGYEEVYNVQLLRFNGTPVTNLGQLAGLVRGALQQQQGGEGQPEGTQQGEGGQGSSSNGDSSSSGGGGFLRFDLDYNEVVVVEAKDVLRVTPEVMRAHSIPYDMSADIRAGLERQQEQTPGHQQRQGQQQEKPAGPPVDGGRA